MTCAFHHPHQPSGDFYEPEAIEAFSSESPFYSDEGLSIAEVQRHQSDDIDDDYY